MCPSPTKLSKRFGNEGQKTRKHLTTKECMRLVIRIVLFKHLRLFSSLSILKQRFSLITAVKQPYPHHKPLIFGTQLNPASNTSFQNLCQISPEMLVAPGNTQHTVSGAQQYKLFIDEGFDIRHIMYMSGHRNEASVRSYNRDCSTAQNQHISHALAKVAKASSSAESSSCMVASPCTFRITTALPQQVHVQPTVSPSLSQSVFNTMQHTSSQGLSSYFISNSTTFNNCTFHFGSNPFNSASQSVVV